MKQRLLTSQEDILARLTHNINYGDGLLVLAGDEGSGKSTIAISLLEELDVYNQALISCPKHIKITEVRKKIVEQFFTDAMFNEEEPLPDILLRLANGRSQSMLVIMDDATSLSDDIVEELLLLPHLQSQGIRLRMVFTTTVERSQELKKTLPKAYGCQVVIVEISTLNQDESLDLYQRLMARATVQPPVGLSKVNRYLDQVQRTPSQVINTVQIALHTPEMLTQNKSLLFYALSGSVAFIILALLGAWIWLMDFRSDVHRNIKHIESSNVKEESLKFEKAKIKPEQKVSEPSRKINDSQASENLPVENIEHHNSVLKEKNFKKEAYQASWPSLGYTIQVASVRQLNSLDSVWSELKNQSNLFLFKRSNRFILMIGHYQNAEEAQEAAVELGLDDSTWIRRWNSIDLHRMERMLLIDAI